MSVISLQVTYRKGKPFAAYIYLTRTPGTKSARTEQVNPELLIDYAADGTPLGIEIVSPGFVSDEDINAVFDRLGLGRPAPAELAPGGLSPPGKGIAVLAARLTAHNTYEAPEVKWTHESSALQSNALL
jgi:uncharacterized protein YuzE